MTKRLAGVALATVMACGGLAGSANASTISEYYDNAATVYDSYYHYSIDFDTISGLSNVTGDYYRNNIGAPDQIGSFDFSVKSSYTKTYSSKGIVSIHVSFDGPLPYTDEEKGQFYAPTGINVEFPASLNTVVVQRGYGDPSVDFTYLIDTVTISGTDLTSVPLPSSALLLSVGLLSLGGMAFARRRHAGSQAASG